MTAREGNWAREYRQGRRELVEQQRIANLIALSGSPYLSSGARRWAINEALRALQVLPEQLEKQS